jgi:hypothetical protein
MPNSEQQGLSSAAFSELKQIVQEEYGDTISAGVVEQMGLRLLRFFSVLAPEEPPAKDEQDKIAVSEREVEALQYLHNAIYHEGKSPSIRDICQAMDLRSSRSGFRLLNQMMSHGLVYRDEKNQLRLPDKMARCDNAEDQEMPQLAENLH